MMNHIWVDRRLETVCLPDNQLGGLKIFLRINVKKLENGVSRSQLQSDVEQVRHRPQTVSLSAMG